MATPDQIVSAARSMIGAPWVHQGRSPKTGVDCVGFVVLLARACGIHIKDKLGYRRRADGQELIRAASEHGVKVLKADRRPGDIAIMSYTGVPDHVAVIAEYQGRETIIHASFADKKVLEQTLTPDTLRKVLTVYRFAATAEAGNE